MHSMAHLYRDLRVKSLYTDRKFNGGQRGWQEQIETSTTLYIGNLSFYTTEEQIYAFFGRVGEVKRVIMGLDRNTKTPCGFCFVEYSRRSDTEDAVRYIGGCKLDDRILRVDWDGGFVEGRQYGRGRSGGQVREEYRTDYDAGRGGWGKAVESGDGGYGHGGGAGGGGSGYSGGMFPNPRRQSMPAQQRSMLGGQAKREQDERRSSGGMPPSGDYEPSAKRSKPSRKPTRASARPARRETTTTTRSRLRINGCRCFAIRSHALRGQGRGVAVRVGTFEWRVVMST